MTEPYRAPETSHRYVLEQVRAADRDRFLAALFAPPQARQDLLAVLAFNHELARTRTVTREPMLARIRLQWWRDSVGSDAPRAQPIVESLRETMGRRDIQVGSLVALIDAYEEEIDGPLDVVRTGDALADLQLAALGVSDAVSRKAVCAVTAAGLMGEGPERASLLAEARALRTEIDRAALPALMPALAIGRDIAPWRRPLVYWWAARTGRY